MTYGALHAPSTKRLFLSLSFFLSFTETRAQVAVGAAGRLVFQPLALVIPFANGTQPPLPRGFRGPHVVLPPIPGDARLALQPVEGEAYSEVSMFDGGVIALRLMQARRLHHHTPSAPPRFLPVTLVLARACARFVRAHILGVKPDPLRQCTVHSVARVLT